jgi:hypothetical protein
MDLADILAETHATMETIPLEMGFCPERWKHDVGVMLENIPGIALMNKPRIIQLLEVDLKQALWAKFARNVTKLAQHHTSVISKHQYGRSHST